ncbi:MAG: methionine adenosyltransferase [bacterium]|nr:methionine adenosyltransferase [bacterium]
MYKLFTSESVAAGHPDKICDQVSDAIVDAALKNDPSSRVAVETLVTTNRIVLAGEVTTSKKLDYEALARKVVRDLGYTDPELGFSDQAEVEVYIHEQSKEISHGVDQDGAGDQGMMFGFANNETPELMPTPIILAHKLTENLDSLRKKGTLPYLLPDGKSEVTIRYEGLKPTAVERVVLAVAHKKEIAEKELAADLFKELVVPSLEKFKFRVDQSAVIINGAGPWTSPGPASDTGLTGRKIVIDTYGGFARAGGGAFSGKDPTKVDRSGAYAARFLAKNIVAENLADQVEVQVAYVIGQAQPVAKAIETFGTEKKSLKLIEDFAWNLLDLAVPHILTKLDLRKPIYQKTASYGHFGRDHFSWEKTFPKKKN